MNKHLSAAALVLPALLTFLLTAGCVDQSGVLERQPDTRLKPTPAAEKGMLSLPGIFAADMVLQRGIPVPVWGRGPAGATITVRFAGQVKSTTVAPDGRWRLDLDSLQGSAKPQPLSVSSSPEAENGDKTFENVVVGEVWICSGQSNMEWTVARSRDPEKEAVGATYPQIRCFKVPHVSTFEPQQDLPGSWTVCGPDTVLNFTAVGYFFGRDLHEKLRVPIGLISTNWGGTPAESWTSVPVLQQHADWETFKNRIDQMRQQQQPGGKERYERELAEWNRLTRGTGRHIDPGMGPEEAAFAKGPGAKWKTMKLPGLWEQQGLPADGVVWFARTIELPEKMNRHDLLLDLGPIDDYDTTFFNGVKVGEADRSDPDAWKKPRRYPVSGKIVKGGKNTIAVRVFDHYGGGGFGGKPEQLRLLDSDQKPLMNLAGTWQYKVALHLPPRPRKPGGRMGWLPGGLYNAMIAPLIPYAIRGAIWYQGESNAGRAFQYRSLFSDMIRCWRHNWQQGDFPFYFVQLANFRTKQVEPADDAWAELREAQTMALQLKNTGMAVIIDIGEAKDIHPKNKQDVGRRLARIARNKLYGETRLVYSGPRYKSMTRKGDKLLLTFDHVGTGLAAAEIKGEGDYTVRKPGQAPLVGFAVAGKDKAFVWADARIVGKDTIEVRSSRIKDPVAVRYAWHINPICNLYNLEGLPASPFRTDEWPGITVDTK